MHTYGYIFTDPVHLNVGHRAFAGYWSVAATEETAMNGCWLQGPGKELFDALEQALGGVPILAEDLGVITTDVVQLR
jgi:4-alpha-glucanotransferase